jgi:DNA-binding NarL/FixJ family response regulator
LGFRYRGELFDPKRKASGSSNGRHARAAGGLLRTARAALRRLDRLTARASDMLERRARARANAEIAAELGIRSETVRNVVSVLFGNLRAKTRAEATVKVRDAGYGRQ